MKKRAEKLKHKKNIEIFLLVKLFEINILDRSLKYQKTKIKNSNRYKPAKPNSKF